MRKNQTNLLMRPVDSTIYRLTVVRREISENPYMFGVQDDELYYYWTKEDAETQILRLRSSGGIYNFVIEECPLGRNVRKNARRRWVYDRNGQYVSGKVCSELKDERTGEPDETFSGREPDQCRFKPGDLVEVRRGNLVTLEIVYRQPPTPDDMNSCGKRFASEGVSNLVEEDCREDSYITLGNSGDQYAYRLFDSTQKDAYVTDVMPPRRRVNDKVAECLKNILKAVEFEMEVVCFDETLLPPRETGLKYRLSIRSRWSVEQPVVVVDVGDNRAFTFSVGTDPVLVKGYENRIPDAGNS